MNEQNRNIFRSDAKTIVDMLFDAKLFRDDLTRDQMSATEDFLTFCLQSRHDSHLRWAEIGKQLEEFRRNKAEKEEQP